MPTLYIRCEVELAVEVSEEDVRYCPDEWTPYDAKPLPESAQDLVDYALSIIPQSGEIYRGDEVETTAKVMDEDGWATVHAESEVQEVRVES